MSSVSGISSTYSAYANLYSTKRSSIDTSTMAEELFSKLDSSGKGYIEESDLASALSSLASNSSTSGSSSASDIFTQLDSDSDGKVTQDELSTGLAKLAESLNSQFDQMRMGGGMPPPPPPSDASGESDSGFTKDELTAQLDEIGSTDTQRASLISSIVENFDAADSNSDGKVTAAEAMSYAQSASSSTSTAASVASSATSGTDTGFTKDQLTAQLEEIGSTDSQRSSLISSIVNNFDAADTNGDGVVSNAEAMAYDQSTNGSSSSSSTVVTNSDAQIFQQLMALMRAYGDSSGSSLSTLVSTSV